MKGKDAAAVSNSNSNTNQQAISNEAGNFSP